MSKTSRCPKCDGSSFELAENSPKGGAYKLYFVQCSGCGVVVGTQEYYSVGALVMKLAKKLGVSLD